MRLSLSIAVLLLGLAPAVVAQDAISLGDVARQSREHAGAVKHTWDDQNSDFGRSTEDSGTPCGAPLPSVQNGYISSLVGRPLQDPALASALMHWLEKHPDLDVLDPQDLARISFPRTSAQAMLEQETAHAAADHWLQETVAVIQSGEADPQAAISTIMNTPLKSNADTLLAQAVAAEQQRRIRSDGSQADKLQEAVNLYSICESRHQAQFEPEVDSLAKQEFQKRITELAQNFPAPEKHDAANQPAKSESAKGM